MQTYFKMFFSLRMWNFKTNLWICLIYRKVVRKTRTLAGTPTQVLLSTYPWRYPILNGRAHLGRTSPTPNPTTRLGLRLRFLATTPQIIVGIFCYASARSNLRNAWSIEINSNWYLFCEKYDERYRTRLKLQTCRYCSLISEKYQTKKPI